MCAFCIPLFSSGKSSSGWPWRLWRHGASPPAETSVQAGRFSVVLLKPLPLPVSYLSLLPKASLRDNIGSVKRRHISLSIAFCGTKQNQHNSQRLCDVQCCAATETGADPRDGSSIIPTALFGLQFPFRPVFFTNLLNCFVGSWLARVHRESDALEIQYQVAHRGLDCDWHRFRGRLEDLRCAYFHLFSKMGSTAIEVEELNTSDPFQYQDEAVAQRRESPSKIRNANKHGEVVSLFPCDSSDLAVMQDVPDLNPLVHILDRIDVCLVSKRRAPSS